MSTLEQLLQESRGLQRALVLIKSNGCYKAFLMPASQQGELENTMQENAVAVSRGGSPESALEAFSVLFEEVV